MGRGRGASEPGFFPGGGVLRLYLSCSQQASFLITNALRFMLNAPGVTSWQYTLLQLQVTTVLSAPSCVSLSLEAVPGLSLSLCRPRVPQASA